MFKDIEERSELFFIFIYGFGGAVSIAYIKEEVNSLIQREIISLETKIVPIVISGYISNEKYVKTITPAFAASIDIFKSIPLENDGRFIGPMGHQKENHIKKEIIPIYSPLKALYGEIYLPNKLDEVKFPIAFIYYDFFESGFDENKEVAFKYLVEYITYSLVKKVKKPKWKDNLNVPDLSNKIGDLFLKRTREIDSKISLTTANIEGLEKKMLQEYKALNEYLFLKKGYSNTEELIRQINLINKNPDVYWVDINSNYLMFLTSRIEIETIIEDENKRFDIGNLLIKVDILNGEVYFENVSQRAKGISTTFSSHPHDSSSGSGKMCLGEIRHFVPKLISEMELATLTQLLINFARSVNVLDGAGKHITEWQQK